MKIWLNKMKDWVVEHCKNLWAFVTGRTITFEEYLRWECNEIFGDDNRWYAGQNLQHPPTDLDLQDNYLCHEADKLFRKKHRYLVERRWQKKVKGILLWLREALAAFSLLREAFAGMIRLINYRKWVSD